MSIQVEVSRTYTIDVDEKLWEKFDGTLSEKVATVADNIGTPNKDIWVRYAEVGDWEVSKGQEVVGMGTGDRED